MEAFIYSKNSIIGIKEGQPSSKMQCVKDPLLVGTYNLIINKRASMDYLRTERKKLKEWFMRFAEIECKAVSPFYYFLSKKIAEDDQLIDIAAHCKQRQPVPNLFLASIHYLLLESPVQELSEYYPSISEEPRQALPFELFKEFCLDHRKEIISLEKTKIVQTNALNRSAYLMPIFSNIFDGKAVNIIDIGTSAGLTLHLDKYEYHFNDRHFIGESPKDMTFTI